MPGQHFQQDSSGLVILSTNFLYFYIKHSIYTILVRSIVDIEDGSIYKQPSDS